MAEKTVSHDPTLARYVEKQMRNWEISRTQHHPAGGEPRAGVMEFITLGNVVGAGGGEVAELLGHELGWPVFDRGLLTRMAHDDEARAQLYRSMDERDLGWLETTMRYCVDTSFRKNDYFHRLVETVLGVARHRSAIFVGRSADLILPRQKGLRVKVVASPERCAANFAARGEVSVEAARQEIARIEAERQEFIRNHFHIDAHEPSRFDLILNVEQFTMRQAVDLILAALAARRARLADANLVESAS